MVDVREDILVRLLEVVATIPNVRMAERNATNITEDDLPAVVVFDGDEETSTTNKTSRAPGLPMVAQMTPQILMAQQANEAGSDLNTLRRELIKRVLFDTELIAKTGTNGAIRYLGCQTDLGWARQLHGMMQAQFMFQYPLKPDDL